MRNGTNRKDNWEVYIIRTVSDRLYTGIARDSERRFLTHAGGGKRGARFFRISAPVEIVYKEKFSNRSEASRREYEIKQLTRLRKWELIEKYRKRRKTK